VRPVNTALGVSFRQFFKWKSDLSRFGVALLISLPSLIPDKVSMPRSRLDGGGRLVRKPRPFLIAAMRRYG
jgi:hypothetical protein